MTPPAGNYIVMVTGAILGIGYTATLTQDQELALFKGGNAQVYATAPLLIPTLAGSYEGGTISATYYVTANGADNFTLQAALSWVGSSVANICGSCLWISVL